MHLQFSPFVCHLLVFSSNPSNFGLKKEKNQERKKSKHIETISKNPKYILKISTKKSEDIKISKRIKTKKNAILNKLAPCASTADLLLSFVWN